MGRCSRGAWWPAGSGVLALAVLAAMPCAKGSGSVTVLCVGNQGPGGLLMSCSSRKLESVPEDLPRVAHTIDLGDNDIEYLAPYVFKVRRVCNTWCVE